jgi:hypothetical protein
MTEDGHDELKDVLDTIHDCAAHGDGVFRDRQLDLLEQALRNLAWRVLTLERNLEAAEETICRLEGK